MKETARVIALDEASIWVETRRQSSCQTCSANKACGQGLMSRMMPGREHYLRALVGPEQREGLTVGDMVEIVVPDEVVLRASLVVYMVPLLLLIVGMFIGIWLVPGDPGAIVGGIVGLLTGAAVVRWHAHAVRNDCRIQPRVVAVAAAEAEAVTGL